MLCVLSSCSGNKSWEQTADQTNTNTSQSEATIDNSDTLQELGDNISLSWESLWND